MNETHIGTPAESIEMAFNLGVAFKQQNGNVPVAAASQHLSQIIYNNMHIQYTGIPEEQIITNAEYFSQIALLGFILPGVAAPDPALKKILIESLIKGLSALTPPQDPAHQIVKL